MDNDHSHNPPHTGYMPLSVTKWRDDTYTAAEDFVAEEIPLALEYNGSSHAVMMATPMDMADFALGFSITEGILQNPSELYDCEIAETAEGIIVKMQIANERFWSLKEKRRAMTGRSSCGVCGTESLDQAVRTPAATSSNTTFSVDTLHAAFVQMASLQHIQKITGATHAAGWLAPSGTVTHVREDIGRHNAVDKLIGACLRQNTPLNDGALIVTSRASMEIVQKATLMGIGILAAVSAPTSMAIRLAQASGLTLVGFTRKQSHVVYTHPHRITPNP